MKVTQLRLEPGQRVQLYVHRFKDGSGSSMGAGVEGNPLYLQEMVWCGPIYNGTVGHVAWPDGKPLGLPISAADLLAANPDLPTTP